MPPGYLALLLELHHPLPGPGRGVGPDWGEAATTTYWPILRALTSAAEAGLAEVVTVAVSPSWTALAADAGARAVAAQALKRRAQEADGGGWPAYWKGLRDFALGRWHSDPLAALKRAADSAAVEVIPTTASHAWLPGVVDLHVLARAQVKLALADHARALGHWPAGLWLPHLAYRPDLERVIASVGARYFTVDAQALVRGTARPPADQFGIVVTPAGAAAFGVEAGPAVHLRDPDAHYRRDPRYADPAIASAAIADQTAHFLSAWRNWVAAARAPGPEPPISVLSCSASDLGGRWLLGGLWLEQLLKRLADEEPWRPTTPGRYLDRFPTGPMARPGPSAGGWPSVRPAGSDLIDRCRAAADLLADLVDQRDQLGPLARRACAQMTRMLLIAQSLDWHLPPDQPLGAEQGLARAEGCLGQVYELAGLLAAGRLDAARLTLLEGDRPCYLPEIDLELLAEG